MVGIFYLLFVWTGIPGIVSLIEGIVFLVSDQENWDQKYNDGMAAGPNEGSSALIIILVIVGVGFVFVAVIGILAAITIPAYQDYTIRARIQEGVNVANEPRTAVGISCSEGTLEAGMGNSELGLGEPSQYAGTVVRDVEVFVEDGETAHVVITYNAIGARIEDGATVAYTGSCSASGMDWEVSGTIPAKFLPKT